MSKFNVAQTSFKRGYLSKRFAGSTSLEDYFEGVEEIINFFPLPQGGVKKRNGSTHLQDWAMTYDGGVPYHQSLAFMYLNGGKSLILAFDRAETPNYIQAYSLAGDTVIANISSEAQVVLNQFLLFDYKVSRAGNILILTSEAGLEPILIQADTSIPDTVSLSVDTWFNATFRDLPNTAYRTPYTKPVADSFSLNTGTITLDLADAYFTPAMVGQYFRLYVDGPAGGSSFVEITSVTSPTIADFTHVYGADFSILIDTGKDLRKAYWGPETGFPQASTGFQQRTVFGNVNESPDTIFGSSVLSRFFFLTKYRIEDKDAAVTDAAVDYGLNSSVANTDPFVFNIASDYDTAIAWLNGSNVLYIGKIDEERIATGYDDALGPLAVSIQQKSRVGGGSIHSVGIDQGVFFISDDKKSINYLTFNERNGASSAIGAETTALGIVEELGEDVTVDKIISMPGESIILGMLSNGDMVSITYSPSIGNFAWAKHTFGFAVQDVVYSAQDSKLYLMGRYPNTDTLTLESFNIESDFIADYNPLDGAYISNDPVPATVTGLERYAEQEVTVITDNNGIQTKTVSAAGELALDAAAAWIKVGQPISAVVRSMRVSGGAEAGGATNGRPKRVDTLVMDVLNSYGGRWASITGNTRYEKLKYDKAERFTGQIEIKPDTSYSTIPQIQIEHDDLYPFILLNIVYKGVAYYD